MNLYSNFTGKNKLRCLTFTAITLVYILYSMGLKRLPVITCSKVDCMFTYKGGFSKGTAMVSFMSNYKQVSPLPFGLPSWYELLITRRVRWCTVFVGMKFPSLIAGPINPCSVTCIIISFFSICMLVWTMRGFCWDGHICLWCWNLAWNVHQWLAGQ